MKNVFGTMFQIIYLKKKNHNCVFSMCMFVCVFFLSDEKNNILFMESEKERKKE